MTGSLPTTSTPRQSLAATDPSLQPATREEIMFGLGRLFAAFYTADAGEKTDVRTAVYFEALEGIPADCIDAAIREYLSGQIPGHDGRFLPTCAEVARRARWHLDHKRRMAARDARMAEALRVGFIEDAPRLPPKDDGFKPLGGAIRISTDTAA